MKSNGRYFATSDSKVHYVVFKTYDGIYAVYTGNSKINVASGQSQLIKNVPKLKDALGWVRNDIAEYEYREKAILDDDDEMFMIEDD